jgi:MFS family permease
MWICGLIGTMQYLSLSLFAEFWGIPFIQARYGLTPTLAALANSMIFFGWLVGAPLAGWISDRLRLRKLPLFVGSLGAGLLVLIVLYLPNVPLIVLCILLFLFGLFCSVEIICFAIGRELNDIKMSATSVAFINMIIMLGGLISQPAVGMLLDWSWLAAPVLENGNRLYSAANYQWALLVLPAGLFLSALLTKFLHESFQDHAE